RGRTPPRCRRTRPGGTSAPSPPRAVGGRTRTRQRCRRRSRRTGRSSSGARRSARPTRRYRRCRRRRRPAAAAAGAVAPAADDSLHQPPRCSVRSRTPAAGWG
ncbi:unnamed protein product, partial [Ectocarpus sp. 12 AP-2014]